MTALKAHAAAMETCLYCPKLCRHACPVATASGRESVTPWGLMSRGAMILKGQRPLDQATADIWSQCTGCGRCTQACKHEIPVAEVMADARAEAAAGGLVPEALRTWAEADRPSSPAFDGLSEGGEIVLLPGWADDAQCQAAIGLVQHLSGVSPGRPRGGLHTTGHRLVHIGLAAQGRAVTSRVAEAVGSSSEIICLEVEDRDALVAAGCARAITLLQWVTARVKPAGPILGGFKGPSHRVVECCRHDSATRMAVSDVLAHVGVVVDLPESVFSISAKCCGARGGLSYTSPSVAREMARDRVAVPPGMRDAPEAVVAADMTCARHLVASDPEGDPHHQIVHWSQLVYDALKQRQ